MKIESDHFKTLEKLIENCKLWIKEEEIDYSRWFGLDEINTLLKEIERLNNKEEQLIRRLEDFIIIGEQVENEWAVDICKMVIEELKGDSSNE